VYHIFLVVKAILKELFRDACGAVLSFFECPKKDQKRAPPKDYSPFAGGSSVDRECIVISDSVFQCSARDRLILLNFYQLMS
jgi:hypothetical protein